MNLIIMKVAFVAASVGPLEMTFAMLFAFQIRACVLRTINPYFLSLTVAKVLEPLALILRAILVVDVDAVSVGHIVLP